MKPQKSHTKPEPVRSLSVISGHPDNSRLSDQEWPLQQHSKKMGLTICYSGPLSVNQDIWSLKRPFWDRGERGEWKRPKDSNEIHLFVNYTRLSSLQTISYLESHKIPVKQMSYRPLLLPSKLLLFSTRAPTQHPSNLRHVVLWCVINLSPLVILAEQEHLHAKHAVSWTRLPPQRAL